MRADLAYDNLIAYTAPPKCCLCNRRADFYVNVTKYEHGYSEDYSVTGSGFAGSYCAEHATNAVRHLEPL